MVAVLRDLLTGAKTEAALSNHFVWQATGMSPAAETVEVNGCPTSRGKKPPSKLLPDERSNREIRRQLAL